MIKLPSLCLSRNIKLLRTNYIKEKGKRANLTGFTEPWRGWLPTLTLVLLRDGLLNRVLVLGLKVILMGNQGTVLYLLLEV